jgi:predicted ATPase
MTPNWVMDLKKCNFYSHSFSNLTQERGIGYRSNFSFKFACNNNLKFGNKMNHKQIYKLYTNNFLYDKNYRHGTGAKLEGSVQQLSDN